MGFGPARVSSLCSRPLASAVALRYCTATVTPMKSLPLFLLVVATCFGQVRERGPYTVHPIIPGVMRIEDANEAHPAGVQVDPQGKQIGFNNCSDMYLIVGRDQALLIDLSNFIKWDSTAIASLQSIVHEEIGTRKLNIAFTHHHGDHTGMLPAFREDRNVSFWIQPDEFSNRGMFPGDRTISIPTHPALDLGGGFIVNALEIPGHTDHSTAYFLEGRNLAFTGDGIGSGNGVWIFSAKGFSQYRLSVDQLIAYIRAPANQIDEDKLVFFGGHYWQKRGKEKLTMQYLLDMQTLIGEIKAGRAREEPVSFGPYLDTNFISGEATITWNKADARAFARSAGE
jgi:glyoxylase-like metal-dependent hydrolase (beta-lactamase superfamily II)